MSGTGGHRGHDRTTPGRDQGGAGVARPSPEAHYRDQPLRLTRPAPANCAAVFSSPHSGRAYFAEFVAASRLGLRALRASEDAFVDELFAAAPAHGAPLVAAVAPRAFVDVNRCASDIDPVLVEGAPKRTHNARVAAGLGVVPRIVAEGVPIYDRRLPLAEVERRIELWHAPYHLALVEELLAARRRFGWSLLLDCHSMPSVARAGLGRRPTADIILGDRFGVSSSAPVTDAIESAFLSQGFTVSRNAPFAGGFITERYGRPTAGVHAIQIEVDRGLYLNEDLVAHGPNFIDVRNRIGRAVAMICAFARGGLGAAEAAE